VTGRRRLAVRIGARCLARLRGPAKRGDRLEARVLRFPRTAGSSHRSGRRRRPAVMKPRGERLPAVASFRNSVPQRCAHLRANGGGVEAIGNAGRATPLMLKSSSCLQGTPGLLASTPATRFRSGLVAERLRGRTANPHTPGSTPGRGLQPTLAAPGRGASRVPNLGRNGRACRNFAAVDDRLRDGRAVKRRWRIRGPETAMRDGAK